MTEDQHRYIAHATRLLRMRRAADTADSVDLAVLTAHVASLASHFSEGADQADGADLVVTTGFVSAVCDIIADRINSAGSALPRVLDSIRPVLARLDGIPVAEDFRAGRYRTLRDTIDTLLGRLDQSRRNAETIADAARKRRQRRRLAVWGAVIIAVAAAAGVGWLLRLGSLHSRLRDIMTSPTEDAYIAYISDHPSGPYTDEAVVAYLAYMDSVVVNSPVSRTGETAPMVRMQQFASSAAVSDDVSRAIHDHLSQLSRRLYAEALGTNTLDAWTTFQARVPEIFLFDSPERVDSIEALAWSTDATAWLSASARDNRDSYTRYLELYPGGAHAAQAQARLVDIDVNDYRLRGRDILDRIEKIADWDLPYARVCIYNESDYPISVLFSGPASQRMQLAPHAYEEADLTPGTYKVLSLIDNPTHDRFTFTQPFSSGIYSSTISLNNPSNDK